MIFLDQAESIGGMCEPGWHWPEPWTRNVSVGNEDQHEETLMICDSCQHSIDDIERTQDLPADYFQVTR